MKQLLPWLRGADAAREDLETQLEHARAALTKAEEQTANARAAFDADPTAEPKLRAAIDAEASARLHVERAERLLSQAHQAEAARKRAELEARRDQLELELSPAALDEKRRPMAEREAQLLIELAQLRAQRRELEVSIRDQAYALTRTKKELGEPVSNTFLESFGFAPPQQAVRKQLEAFIAGQPRDSEARRFADRLMDQLIGSVT